MDKDEQLQENQETEYNQNKSTLHIQKRLTILIFVGLFFIAFGTGAFYLGKQSMSTPILPSVTPITVISSPVPTNNQFPTLNPTSTVIDSMSPPQIDYSCQSDADCVIKNVGNCCGYYPKCMNTNSKPNPDYVKKQCEKMKIASVCGYPTIDSCKCVNNMCK